MTGLMRDPGLVFHNKVQGSKPRGSDLKVVGIEEARVMF
jgi:hypothetical protein